MGKARCSSSCSTQGSAPRIERKIIEKNRRNRMKSFYSNLFSLLPNHNSKEGLPLPDQIDEAVEYIKSLKMKLEKARQKKESLLLFPRERSVCITSENQATNDHSPPLIEVHDMGPNMDVILANGLEDYSTFHGIVSLLHQHGVEIAGASFSREGNSTIQVLQDNKVGKSNLAFGGATMSGRLKELVCGTSRSEVVESQLNLWDYEIETNFWGFQIPEVLPSGN